MLAFPFARQLSKIACRKGKKNDWVLVGTKMKIVVEKKQVNA